MWWEKGISHARCDAREICDVMRERDVMWCRREMWCDARERQQAVWWQVSKVGLCLCRAKPPCAWALAWFDTTSLLLMYYTGIAAINQLKSISFYTTQEHQQLFTNLQHLPFYLRASVAFTESITNYEPASSVSSFLLMCQVFLADKKKTIISC